MQNKEIRNISTLRLWKDNPREISKKAFESLKKKIKRWGQFKPVLITKDGEVIGGNMRLRAYLDLGIEDVWVSVVNPKDEAEKIEIAMTDNESSGRWDEQALAELIEPYKTEIELGNYELDLGKTTPLNELLDQFGPEVVEDEVPEISQEEPKSKLGEIYQLGRHRIMCGDSTKIEDVERLMDGNKADMVFTDPPYLMGFEGNVHADGSKSFNAKHGAIDNDKMSREDGDEFIYNIFTTISLFNKGAYYVCFYRLGLDYIFRALDRHNNKYRALIIWDKGNHTLSNSDYMSRYEPIVYGWFKEHKFYGDRSNFDIWHIDRTAKNELHPTMKPIELCVTAIRNSSVEDDIVFDGFLGSGSTLIACEQTNRICYGMEIDNRYIDVIIKRWQTFTGNEAIRISDGIKWNDLNKNTTKITT